jgi:hypothetical protein
MTGEESMISLTKNIWRIRWLEMLKEFMEGQKARLAAQAALAKVLKGVIKLIKGGQKAVRDRCREEAIKKVRERRKRLGG